jgi:hypothetical protein
MKTLLFSTLMLVSAHAFASPQASVPEDASVVTLAQPTTLYEEADLNSKQIEVAPGEILALGEDRNGFANAAVVGPDGSPQKFGFLESAMRARPPHLWPRNPHDLHHRN